MASAKAPPDWEVTTPPPEAETPPPSTPRPETSHLVGERIPGFEDDTHPDVLAAGRLSLLELYESALVLDVDVTNTLGRRLRIAGARVQPAPPQDALGALELAELYLAGPEGARDVLRVAETFEGRVQVGEEAVLMVFGKPTQTEEELRADAKTWPAGAMERYKEIRRHVFSAANRGGPGGLGRRARLAVACYAAQRAVQQEAIPW